MFKELLLALFVSVVVSFILFRHAVKQIQQYTNNKLRHKYLKCSSTINSDTNNTTIDEESKYDSIKEVEIGADSLLNYYKSSSDMNNDNYSSFYQPLLYSSPLFNEQSKEVQKLRNKHRSIFKILDEITHLIIRDFIHHWYKTFVSDDEKFATHIKYAINNVFHILVSRIMSANWTDFLTQAILIPVRDLLKMYKLTFEELNEDEKFQRMTELKQLCIHFL